MGDAVDPWSRSDEGEKDQKSNQKENKTKNNNRNKTKNKETNQQKRKPKIFTIETSCPKGTRDEKQRNEQKHKKQKTNHLQTNQTPLTPKSNKPKTSLEPDLGVLTAMTPNKNLQPGAEQPPAGRTSCRGALAVGPTPNLTPLGLGREGTRECASLLAQPQLWANGDRYCLGQEAQGPEPPTKWSFPEGKRERTQTTLHQILSSFIQRLYRVFSVSLNRMCVPSTCLLSPAPQLSPTRQGVSL